MRAWEVEPGGWSERVLWDTLPASCGHADRWLSRVDGLEAMGDPIRNPQQRRDFKMSLAARA